MISVVKKVALGLLSIVGIFITVSALPLGVSAAETQYTCYQPQSINYSFIHTYNSACSTTQNWDRSFSDVRIATPVDNRNVLSLTASTSLAGAIGSLKVNDKEFIAAGGHGSAWQIASHAWANGQNPSECYNPTQAGSARDDDNYGAPYHGPSTSALYKQKADSSYSLSTESRMAMFIPRTSEKTGYGGCRPADYQPNTSPFTYGLSPYWLRTKVTMGKKSNNQSLDNVIRTQATINSEDTTYDNFDSVLISYLQRDFTDVYSYNPQSRKVVKQNNTVASHEPLIRCTADKSYCFGMYFKKGDMPADSYYYAMTNPPSAYNGMTGESTVQITSPSKNIGKNATSQINYNYYAVIGNLERVRTTLVALNR